MPTGTKGVATTGFDGLDLTVIARKVMPLWFIGPGLVLASFIILYPLWEMVQTSLRQVNRFGQVRDFNDFQNYTAVFADPLFYESLGRTGLWTVLVVGGTILLAAPVALMLNQRFHGRALARVLMLLPWSVALSLLAVVWRWALNAQSGYFNLLMQQLGLIDRPVVWLATGSSAFTIQVILGILVSIPFTVTIFLGGLSSIPEDLYEAARMEGARGWHSFWTITSPMMRPFLNIALVLNVIHVFNSFSIIWILTEGGPANSTDIIITYLYKIAFNYGRLGEASVVSLLMMAFLIVCTVIYLGLISREKTDG